MLSSDVLDENASTSYGKYFGTSSIFFIEGNVKINPERLDACI